MSESEAETYDKTEAVRKTFVSPIGWYLASILIRFEWYGENMNNPNRRCKAWENSVLIQANSPDEAYEKALIKGQEHDGEEMWDADDETRRGRWRFEGLTGLLAIYEELADGSEIMWREHENKSVRTIKNKIQAKADLEVFGG